MNPYVQNLNRIEIMVTDGCTGRCRHCSQGEHNGAGGCVDVEAVERAIREACGAFAITSLMAFGGEALLYPEAVCRIFRAGADCAIPRIELITNGFFSRSVDKIYAVTRMLANSGLTGVLLSVDAFHQETIPLGPVKYFARRLRAEGIPVKLSPAWLGGPEGENSYNERTRAILREFDGPGIPTGEGNTVFPAGNAARYLGAYFPPNAPLSTPYDLAPHDVRAITVSPTGDVLDGNLRREGILEILERYKG